MKNNHFKGEKGQKWDIIFTNTLELKNWSFKPVSKYKIWVDRKFGAKLVNATVSTKTY